MRRRRALVVALLVVLAVPAATAAAAPGLTPPAQPAVTEPPPGWPPPPAATAAAYVLVSQDSGQVLAERAADERRPVASTIKILTALSVLARTSPEEVVTIGDEVVGIGGASVGLAPGQRWTVDSLLDALIVRSGNDAAIALAVHVGGSVEGFVALMRQDAAALGLEDVVIETPNGLDDRNRLSAHDLATLSRAAMADPRFREVAAKASVELPTVGRIASRNLLLGRYEGATGIKTGYTSSSGWSVIGSASRGGVEYIAVVLAARGDATRFEEAAALLDHAFGSFRPLHLGVDLRFRDPGRWVSLSAAPVTVAVPANDDVTVSAPGISVEVPTRPDDLGVVWNGHELARTEAVLEAPDAPPVGGGAALGAFVLGRAYASMRALTAADGWEAVPGVDTP